MADRIVYIDHSRVKEGSLAGLKVAMTDLVDFIQENEPDIRSYDVYFSPDGEGMTVVHRHDTQASLEYHMEVPGHKFPPHFGNTLRWNQSMSTAHSPRISKRTSGRKRTCWAMAASSSTPTTTASTELPTRNPPEHYPGSNCLV